MSDRELVTIQIEVPKEMLDKGKVTMMYLDKSDFRTHYWNLSPSKIKVVEKQIVRTNADRIRNMTDEELAKHIDNGLDYPVNKKNCLVCEGISCYKCILEWLQKVVEE